MIPKICTLSCSSRMILVMQHHRCSIGTTATMSRLIFKSSSSSSFQTSSFHHHQLQRKHCFSSGGGEGQEEQKDPTSPPPTSPPRRHPQEFPWRHNDLKESMLLPRLVPGTEESQNDLNVSDYAQAEFALTTLRVPWWKYLFFHTDWREEFAEPFAYAFSRGLAGILSNAYHVPLVLTNSAAATTTTTDPTTSTSAGASVIFEEDTGRFSFSFPGSSSLSSSGNEESKINASKGGETTGVSKDNDETEKKKDTEKKKNDTTETKEGADSSSSGGLDTSVDSMVDRALRNLFQTAHQAGLDHHHHHQLNHADRNPLLSSTEMRLDVQPKDATLYRVITPMLFVSRHDYEHDPALRRLLVESHDSTSRLTIDPTLFEYSNQKFVKHGKLEMTVEAQILIYCDEVFFVKDMETGEILQGSEPSRITTTEEETTESKQKKDDDSIVDDSDEKQEQQTTTTTTNSVVHLARFESTFTVKAPKNQYQVPEISVGDWVLTDIDDLVYDGVKNVPWYLKR